MNITLLDILIYLFRGFGFISSFYVIPYLIRLGWNSAENRTKKVCDVCFRDISLVNKAYKKAKKED